MSGSSPAGTGTDGVAEALARLQQIAAELAGLAQSFAGAPAGPSAADWVGRYQRLLLPPAPAPEAGATAEALARWQRASQRQAVLCGGIAADAFRRLSAALADESATPIESLRELHALWIDCGEAAWSEAAHREDFAEAQAEWIAAFAGLHRPGGAP